jgi:hydroxymethylpyrimidine pyrophosphatase-like HAD family hydrolase
MTAAKELQMDSYMISYNGAVITDLKEDRIILNKPYPRTNTRIIKI